MSEKSEFFSAVSSPEFFLLNRMSNDVLRKKNYSKLFEIPLFKTIITIRQC